VPLAQASFGGFLEAEDPVAVACLSGVVRGIFRDLAAAWTFSSLVVSGLAGTAILAVPDTVRQVANRFRSRRGHGQPPEDVMPSRDDELAAAAMPATRVYVG